MSSRARSPKGEPGFAVPPQDPRLLRLDRRAAGNGFNRERRIASGCGPDDPAPMSVTDSALDSEAMAQARSLLSPPPVRERLWPVVAAAAFAAVAALALAGAMITAPPVVSQPMPMSEAEDYGPAL